jgi:hypothetical protein
MGDSVDWTAFPTKFMHTAEKILAKMHSNALLMLDQAKRSVEDLSRRNR